METHWNVPPVLVGLCCGQSLRCGAVSAAGDRGGPRSTDRSRQQAEKVTSLGKDWHRACLKCKECGKTLSSGGHAEHQGEPYCHRPCYAKLFGPSGVRAGGAADSYKYDKK